MKYISNFLLCLVLIFFTSSVFADNIQHDPEHTIWFTSPATDWRTQALHLGNGYMGISFYGGVATESFDIAEKTFFTGGPNVTKGYNYGIVPGGKEHIAELRQLVLAGKYREADHLARQHFFGTFDGYGYFSKVGDLHLDFIDAGTPVTHYERGLDLRRSLGYVHYIQSGVKFDREYFCSYPDHSFVAHVRADQPGKVSFVLRPEWQYPTEKVEKVHDNEWLIRGLIDKSGLKYAMRLRLVNEGGQVVCSSSEMSVKGANQATLYYTVETEYKMQPPSYKGNDPVSSTASTFDKIKSMSYEKIRKTHIDDYTSLYDRVSFHLEGDKALSLLPTDRRIKELKAGMVDDSQLKSLWFNFGRYLIISASRKGTLPSNLQGVWNHFEMAPWNGHYQSNINLQEMYWSCGPTDLPECQQSYVDWVQTLVEPGRLTAAAYYGSPGWVSHATTNIWGYTSPGNDLIWGLYPAAAAWHCRNIWDQYVFTNDVSYLKTTAYPIMKEAALFYLSNLTATDEGLCFIPSVTAEHGVEMEENMQSPVKYSHCSGESNMNKCYLVPCYQDIEMIYDLFSNVISAGKILKCDKLFLKKLQNACQHLVPLKIGRFGQLQEWLIDADNPRDHHRHIAHLYALYPGEMITANTTPELFAAAKKSLDLRGDGVYKSRWPHSGGNWSSAWRMACRARLFEGERAIHIFNEMIRNVGFDNMMSNQSGHMQVDATMATPALFAELLLQSHDGCLHLLPALPSEWPSGHVQHLVARGGYRVSLQWDFGKLTQAVIQVPSGKQLPPLKLNGQKLSNKDKRLRIIQK